MDLCPSDWFDSNLRKHETTSRIDGIDNLEQPEEQFNQVLNNYFHFSNPTNTTWFQQGLHLNRFLFFILQIFIIFARIAIINK
ncbi:unnamed protein product [Brugia pahangi]|uniref:Transmembrane protein n=1 Tax=Brugia pahangi TaxID=6280 RepID=A0A0N4TBL8_BRUPA|nr:unnamed protein product [Brugia pahangi]